MLALYHKRCEAQLCLCVSGRDYGSRMHAVNLSIVF